MIVTLNGFDELSSLPPAVNQQLRDIARRLATDMPVSEEEFQRVFTKAEEQERDKSALYSKILKNAGIGIIICLVLFIVSIIGKKVNEKKKNEKHRTVNETLRTAPYILFIPVPSTDADRVGRQLVEKRLAARVDILANYFLAQNADADRVLVINTVKGRLKTLNKFFKDLSLSHAGLSFSVLSGHETYLTWIADAADGRG